MAVRLGDVCEDENLGDGGLEGLKRQFLLRNGRDLPGNAKLQGVRAAPSFQEGTVAQRSWFRAVPRGTFCDLPISPLAHSFIGFTVPENLVVVLPFPSPGGL